MKRFFALAAAVLVSLSVLAGPAAQAYEGDPPPVPPVEDPEPGGVMPAGHPHGVEED